MRPPSFCALLSLALIGGCPSVTNTLRPSPAQAPPHEAPPAPRFSSRPTTRTLVVLHTSDSESELLGETEGSGPAKDRAGGISRATSLVRALTKRTASPVLLLAAGDTFLAAPALKIRVDDENAVARSNNLLGYHASALGNHELDLGDSFLDGYLGSVRFPYLSATVEAKGGPLLARQVTPDEHGTAYVNALNGRLAPRAKACLGERQPDRCDGLVVGLVGLTTPTLRTISNPSGDLDIAASLEEAQARVQAQVDALTEEGTDLVVLVSHLQDVRLEVELVTRGLVGVDIIVAGGGDNRLADREDRLLAEDEPDAVCQGRASDCYPLALTARDGRPVLVVATDGQLRYVGQLEVGFDDEGVLTGFDEQASRPWPVDEVSLLELRAEPARDAVIFEATVRETLKPLMEPFAETTRFLEGRREAVRNRQTNLGDLAADSLAHVARAHPPAGVGRADFALRNGGGIRAPIGSVHRDTHALLGGPITRLDLESSLRFDGSLVVVSTTHRGLKETLEAALRGAGDGRGHFPQVSREVILEYTKRAPAQTQVLEEGRVVGVECPGRRVWTLRIARPGEPPLEVVREGVLLTPDAEVSFATLSYLARGGDGWFPGQAAALRSAVIAAGGAPLKEQAALRAYIEELERRGEWRRGEGYPDPEQGKPETFTRIREVDVEGHAGERCPRLGRAVSRR